jgi:hypothetical protein
MEELSAGAADASADAGRAGSRSQNRAGDHSALRNDVLMQTACERDKALASAPTLCRLENRASRAAAWAIHEVMVEKFIASFKQAPAELVLDFDATDDPLHGKQEGRLFHGYTAANSCSFRICVRARSTNPSTGDREAPGRAAAQGLAGGANHPAGRHPHSAAAAS